MADDCVSGGSGGAALGGTPPDLFSASCCSVVSDAFFTGTLATLTAGNGVVGLGVTSLVLTALAFVPGDFDGSMKVVL